MSSEGRGGGIPGRHNPLDPIFCPRAVAVVGASADPRKRGYQAVRALQEGGYTGEIHPVNPKGGELLGLPVLPSVEALPDGVDLALVCLPGSTVPATLEACAARGIRGAVVLATGFKETGEEGVTLEARVRDVARRTGIRVVGPNTSGVIRPEAGLNLVGVGEVPAGSLALLLQSGNVALALLREARHRPGTGISTYVGVGNETDIGFHEYLAWLAEDQRTRAVLVYADDFREPRAFLEVAVDATRVKPVVVLKSGRTEAGARAALSHTGAIASPWALLRAGLRQAGVTVVERADELLPVGQALASQPPVAPGTGIAILADGGGHGALAADALAEMGVTLVHPSGETRNALREILGPTAAVGNPVDIGGPADAEPGVFVRALEALAADPGVGGVLLVGLFGGYHLRFAAELEESETEAAVGMAGAMRAAGKPLVASTLYADAGGRPLAALGEAGVPVVGSVEIAGRCVAALADRGAWLARPAWDPSLPRAAAADPAPVAGARAGGRTALTEPEARELVEAFGVELVPAACCRTEEEAATLVARIAAKATGVPDEPAVALKLISPFISHKTERGGVELGIRGERAVREAFRRIRGRAVANPTEPGEREAGPPSPFHGVLVALMLPSPIAELLVGARREPGLGPVLTVAAGGTAVELLGDATHRMLPAGRDEVERMLRQLRTAGLLEGHRGRAAANLRALADLAAGIARCLLACPALAEVEANPVFAYPDRAVAVDVRAFLRPI